MADLTTHYMGLALRNPLVVASCGIMGKVDNVKKAQDAGAGAVVLKSIFEEQIDVDVRDISEQSWLPGHPEAFDYVREMGYALGPQKYLELIGKAKEAVSIPVIASLNCVTPRWWAGYARKIEREGADGLELNVQIRPSDPERTSKEIEKLYFDILDSVKAKVKIPVAFKIGPYFTSLGHVASELSKRGADALVLFNRFYRLDIDVERMELTSGYPFTTAEEIGRTLRWTALLAERVKADIAASTGVHDAQGVVKLLLAGATVTEMCSVLYKNGIEHISTMLAGLEDWMARHNFEAISEFRGRLSQERSEKPELYERMQYIKAIVGME